MRTRKHLKIFSVMVSVIMILSSGTIAQAEKQASTQDEILQATITNTYNLIESIYYDGPENYGFDPSDLANLSLGNKIQTFIVSDKKLKTTESSLFPLFAGSKLIAHITTFYSGNTLESMISTELVNALSEYQGTAPYVIVYDCDGVQLVSKDNVYTIREYTYDERKDSIIALLQEPDFPIDNLLNSANDTDSFVLLDSVNYYCDDLHRDNQEGQINQYQSTEDIGITTSGPDNNLLDLFYRGTVTQGSGNVSLLVPKYNQGQTNLCWAYSVASIGNYMYGSALYTGIQVAQALYGTNYNQGACISDAMDTLYYLYPYYYAIGTGTLSESVLYDYLASGSPVYGHFSAGTTHNHAVVLRAMNTSTHYFSFMNPGTGVYAGTTNNAGSYAFSYNGLTWNLASWGYYYYYYA